MDFAGATDNGKVRSMNEDSFFAFKQGEVLYAIVADGMGGHNAGEVASNEAIRAFESSIQSSSCNAVSERLAEAIRYANRRIFAMTVENQNLTGMGTTITACAVTKTHVYFANVGDSRGYFITNHIEQVTKDHSLVAELIITGDITEAEATTHPQRNVITRAVGTAPTIEVDLFERELVPHSAILLCSDGLSNAVPNHRILQILKTEKTTEKAVLKLIAEANEMGGHDNITALTIRVVEREEKNHE